MRITKRQLAARFVDALETTPLTDLAVATIAVAVDAGYDSADLAGLVAAVEQELQARFGLAEVKLTTAHALPEAVLADLARQVAAAAGLHDARYTHHVDPELLGGFEAQAGDLSLRASIRAELTALEVGRG